MKSLDLYELSKTDTGRKEICMRIKDSANSLSRQADKLCWDLYNNQFDVDQFSYLTKIAGYVLPAKVRHIPKQRPYVNMLASRQLEREFKFSIVATDDASLTHKREQKFRFYVDAYINQYRQVYNQVQAEIQSIQQQRQQLMEQVQQQPRNEEEKRNQDQVRQSMPQIEARVTGILQALNDIQILNEQGIKNLERLRKSSDREMIEELAQKAMYSYRQRYKLKNKSLQNFINDKVSGKQFYLVNYTPGNKNITMDPLPPHVVFYQDTNDVEWVQDLEWCGYESWGNASDIIEQYRSWLTQDQIDSIRAIEVNTTRNDLARPFVVDEQGNAVDMGRFQYPQAGSSIFESGINVKHIWWRVDSPVAVLKKINKYEKGKFFTNNIDPETQVVDQKDYYFNRGNGSWVNREDDTDTVKSTSRVKSYDSRKGESYDVKYMDVRYFGAVINNEIVIADVDPVQPSGFDDPSTVPLPIVGPTYNDITRQPYSYIWATKELQALINITHYHRELMMAVAGTKSLLYDKSQRPEGMSDAEFRRSVKLGVVEIESRKKGAGHLQPSFNQFQIFDMSLADSIRHFDAIINSLDEQMGLIFGLTRQSMGQTVSTDQVGTFQMSQQSSLLITEVMFYQHDEVECEALQMYINLARQYLWTEEQMLSYLNNENDEEIIHIPANVLNNRDYKILITQSPADERKMTELRNVAFRDYSKGMMPYGHFIQLYNINSLMEMIKKAQYFDEQARDIQEKSRDAEAGRQQQIEEMKAKLRGEMQAFVQKQQQEVEKMRLDLDRNRLDLEKYIQQENIRLKERELDIAEKKNEQDSGVAMMQIESRAETDRLKIAVNEKKLFIDQQLGMIKARLEQLKINLDKESRDTGQMLDLYGMGKQTMKQPAMK